MIIVHNHAAQQAEGEAAMTASSTMPCYGCAIRKEKYFVEYKGKWSISAVPVRKTCLEILKSIS
jgi:hypothetical protein